MLACVVFVTLVCSLPVTLLSSYIHFFLFIAVRHSVGFLGGALSRVFVFRHSTVCKRRSGVCGLGWRRASLRQLVVNER